jgi:glycolate oxidase FAD binding subunit
VSIAHELATIVGEDNVIPGDGSEVALDGRKPAVIVRPATSEEVAAIVAWARTTDHALIVSGQGTRLAMGNPPERCDVLLSLARMNRILDYEPPDLTARVEAGCTLMTFNRTAQSHRQWLPLDPPGSDQATLGGIVATDDFGPLRYAYGRPRDYVIGIEVVEGTGRLIKSGGRVVKNVTGYDLNKLFVGSYGTLGVIVRINLKLRPRPDGDATVLVSKASTDALSACARALLSSELMPVAVVLVNSGAGRMLGLELAEPSLLEEAWQEFRGGR